MSTTRLLGPTPSHTSLPPIRRTGVQFGYLTTSEALLRIANLAMMVLIARQFSPSILGVYATAVAVSTFAIMLADNGLQTTAIQVSSSTPIAASVVYSGVVSTKLLLLPIALAIVSCALGTSHGRLWVVWVLIFCRVALQSFSQTNFAILKGLQMVPAIAAIQGCHFLLFASALMVLWQMHLSLAMLLSVVATCQAAEFLAGTVCLHKMGIKIRPTAIRSCLSLMRDAFPVGITATLWTLVLRSDLIILAVFVSTEQLGQYAAAQSVMIAMYLGGWLLGSLLLAELTRMNKQPDMLKDFVSRWSRLFILILVPATVMAVWAAPLFIRVLYGRSYQQSAYLLTALATATPFIWLNSLYLHRAIAVGDNRSYAFVYGITVVLSACASVVLALAFGALGVACGVVCREAGLFAVLFTVAARSR